MKTERNHHVPLYLSDEEMAVVMRYAERNGVTPDAMLRAWIREAALFEQGLARDVLAMSLAPIAPQKRFLS